jgi:methylated-DNA-protein-cysteine methyltransferase related protein
MAGHPGNMDFFERVYQIVRQIPPGKVCTYGRIAEHLALRRSARMVGWALNGCDWFNQGIPAHRVVNRNGLLSGKRYFGGEHTMADLLRSEGVEIVDDQIVNLQKYLWNPEDKPL